MTLDNVYKQAIVPAYALLPLSMASEPATLMLLAIGLQESRFLHRRQIGGPARGFWQFERGGGVVGVLNHPASRTHARAVAISRNVSPEGHAVYAALEHDDVLAAAFARLLLYTDPAPLPGLGREADAWDYYLRNWRPGKPHLGSWHGCYSQAINFVAG